MFVTKHFERRRFFFNLDLYLFLSIIRHAGLFFRSFSSNLTAMLFFSNFFKPCFSLCLALVCCSGTVALSFRSILWVVFQHLSCCVFFLLNKRLFRFTTFCRLFDVLHEMFLLCAFFSECF